MQTASQVIALLVLALLLFVLRATRQIVDTRSRGFKLKTSLCRHQEAPKRKPTFQCFCTKEGSDEPEACKTIPKIRKKKSETIRISEG
jgi:hypothetical protein